jgi:hypothetical protein
MTMIAEALAWALFMIFVARRLFCRGRKNVACWWREISLSTLAFLLILIFFSAAITNVIGLFSIFGAFIVGADVYDQHELREAVGRRGVISSPRFACRYSSPYRPAHRYRHTTRRTHVGLMWSGGAGRDCGENRRCTSVAQRPSREGGFGPWVC